MLTLRTSRSTTLLRGRDIRSLKYNCDTCNTDYFLYISLYIYIYIYIYVYVVAIWRLANQERPSFYSIPNKTEAFVAGTRQQAAKFDTSSGIAVSGSIVPFSPKLCALGVTLDEELTFDDHIIGIALVCTRLDHCNAILYRVTKQSIGRLQRSRIRSRHVFSTI